MPSGNHGRREPPVRHARAARRPPAPQVREDQLVLAPEERREAVIRVIGAARERLILSLFRCNDFPVLDALAEALRRKVRVQALLTSRAKGWKKRLKELCTLLESMNAEVHFYSDPVVKYHAKYVVADDGPALVGSLNFTHKCFENTCDFLQITWDPSVVNGLQRLFESDCHSPGAPLSDDLNDRLVVGPERARGQISALLEQARRSIHILDHRVSDPEMVALLKARQATGIDVQVLGDRSLGNLRAHGKLIVVDGETALFGSISLSPLCLDFRREVALLVRDARPVRRLEDLFSALAAAGPSLDGVQKGRAP